MNITQNVTQTLTKYPSYLRVGNTRLARKFNCSENTVKRIKGRLKDIKDQYETRLKNNN